MIRSAVFDATRVYRYMLIRDWSVELLNPYEERTLCVIGLNPSTANETKDDRTIRRCVDFARRLGCNVLVMVNLFAYRSTDPKVLRKLSRAVAIGPDTDAYIREAVQRKGHVIAAWGNGDLFDRAAEVMAIVRASGREMQCFGLTRDGAPRHPLYQKRNARLVPFEPKPGQFAMATDA